MPFCNDFLESLETCRGSSQPQGGWYAEGGGYKLVLPLRWEGEGGEGLGSRMEQDLPEFVSHVYSGEYGAPGFGNVLDPSMHLGRAVRVWPHLGIEGLDNL